MSTSHDTSVVLVTHPSVAITPPWPGRAFQLACPANTAQETCDRLGSGQASLHGSGCYEPEVETGEVLSSLLLGCERLDHGCTYIDIGCNLGAFAGQAAALGAQVRCFEPTNFFVDAIRATTRLNEGFHERLVVTHAAVVTTPMLSSMPRLVVRDPYRPCYIGLADFEATHARGATLHAPTVGMRSILLAAPRQHVRLLKIDIDSVDGALLHEAVELVAAGEVSIDAMLVELGDDRARLAACNRRENAHSRHCAGAHGAPHHPWQLLRSGDARDLWRLQHELHYGGFRINVHVNQEIYGRDGVNRNNRMSEPSAAWQPLYHVRGMRKLERLRNSTPYDVFVNTTLIGRAQSVLLTTAALAEELLGPPVAKHHTLDLTLAGLGASLAALQDHPLT